MLRKGYGVLYKALAKAIREAVVASSVYFDRYRGEAIAEAPRTLLKMCGN